jgi:hypothetical protein
MTHACETSRYWGEEAKGVLLLCWEGDQSKESCEENRKETSEEGNPETKKALDRLASCEAGKTARVRHGVERMGPDLIQRYSKASY